MTETLRQKQSRFARMIARLIVWATDNGYDVTFGDAYRSADCAALMAKQGKGVARSLHTQRLAIDLNLFRNGTYLPNTKDHEPLGREWEAMGGTWGGRFNDGNHYSLEHEGVK